MNRVVINADLGKHTISRHIYGHFSEHLGTCIYGGYWVGEDSSIPNTRGIRNDVVEALRAIDIPNLRWPGGCFADEYHWKDGIGPRADRPTMINTHWGGVTENNHFGTHEFLDLCDQLGCEPYICGNVGSGTVQEMAQWVEYVNCDGVSPMATLREENGRKDAWKVRFWGVGNENWGCGGRMRPEYYADLYRRYGCYCRNWNNDRLLKIAGGANVGNWHWTEVLMREAWNQMWGLSLHYYTSVRRDGKMRGTTATGFDEAEWFAVMKQAQRIETLVTRHSAIMDQYDPKKTVAMVVDEWGTWHAVEEGTNPRFLYQQNALRDALVASVHLDIFNNHCDRVRMTNIAQTVNVLQSMILTDGEKMLLTPTYHVFDMYRGHMDATLLPLDLQCSDYSLGDDAIPALSGSASKADDGSVTVTLSNLDPHNAATVSCELRDAAATSVTGTVLTASAMDAHNTFDAPDTIKPAPFDGATLDGELLTVELPTMSVISLRVQ